MDETDPTIINLPKGYRLQYWNNSFWVEIANVPGVPPYNDIPNAEPVHEFEAVETSAIRLILTPEVINGNRYISGDVREIEIWGNM